MHVTASFELQSHCQNKTKTMLHIMNISERRQNIYRQNASAISELSVSFMLYQVTIVQSSVLHEQICTNRLGT